MTALNIVKYFERNSLAIDPHFIVSDRYNNFHSGNYLKENGYRVYNIPRRSNSEKSIWNSPKEGEKNFFIIRSFFKKLIKRLIPDLAIMVPYERGLFNVEFIRSCNRNGIQTLLLQEGLVVTDNNKEPFLHDRPFNYFCLGNKGNKNLIGRIYRKFVEKVKVTLRKFKNMNIYKLIDFIKTTHLRIIRLQFPSLRPFGLNGADYIGTLSPFYSSKLIERGLPAEKIRSVGLARFDDIISFSNINLHNIKPPQFRNNETKILYPQSMGLEFGRNERVDHDLNLIKEILPYLNYSKSILTYRLRREENKNNYKELSYLTNVRLESGDHPIYKSIINHDIIFSSGSTILLEALALKRYAIIFHPQKQDNYGYVSSGSCLLSWDISSLVEAINKIVKDAEIRRNLRERSKIFVKERAMIDGKATERTCSFIEDIISNEENNKNTG